MNTLVIGGAGFIGSHVTDALLADGHHVVVFDNFQTGTPENLAAVVDDITLIEGDIRHPESLDKAVADVDWVFHLAACTSVAESFARPDDYFDINVNGTRHVLEAAAKHQAKKIIFSSTCAVYGDKAQVPIAESVCPRPKSPYATSKLMGENLAGYYRQVHALETVCLRYFNVYGERQGANSDYASVISKFMDCYRDQTPPGIYGDGKQSRDFVYVTDIAQANLLAARSENKGTDMTRPINIGTGKQVNLLQLLDILEAHFNCGLTPRFHPERRGDIRSSVADITLAGELLGYRPTVSMEAGLHRLVQNISARTSSQDNQAQTKPVY